jgi:hypothetical protein
LPSGPFMPCRTFKSVSPLSTSPSKDYANGKLLGSADSVCLKVQFQPDCPTLH